jgi:hypothetical protein
VVKILANNSSNPELLAFAAATITRSLQHHTFDAPPTALLHAGLLPALASIIASLPAGASALSTSLAFSLRTAAVVDTVASIFSALLSPCAMHFLNEHLAKVVLEPGGQPWEAAAYAPWRPIYACLMQPSLATYLMCVAFADTHSGSQLAGPIPGLETLKLIGLKRQLTNVYECDNYHFVTYVNEGSVERVLAVYEREMPSGGIALSCAPPHMPRTCHAVSYIQCLVTNTAACDAWMPGTGDAYAGTFTV